MMPSPKANAINVLFDTFIFQSFLFVPYHFSIKFEIILHDFILFPFT